MVTFTTSLDKFNKITTIIIAVILDVILLTAFFLTPNDEKNTAISLVILPVIAFIVVYLLRPNNYSVSADKLLIHRIINKVEINRNNIQSVQEIDVSKVKIAFARLVWVVSLVVLVNFGMVNWVV